MGITGDEMKTFKAIAETIEGAAVVVCLCVAGVVVGVAYFARQIACGLRDMGAYANKVARTGVDILRGKDVE